MIFEMVPYNFQFDFRQFFFNPFESSDGKFFQDDRDSDLNCFDEINIPSKGTTNINGTDIKKIREHKDLRRHKDLRTFLLLIQTTEDRKPISKTFAIF